MFSGIAKDIESTGSLILSLAADIEKIKFESVAASIVAIAFNMKTLS